MSDYSPHVALHDGLVIGSSSMTVVENRGVVAPGVGIIDGDNETVKIQHHWYERTRGHYWTYRKQENSSDWSDTDPEPAQGRT